MEEWRDVPGAEGKYQISISTKEGKCRSLNYNNTGKVKELSNKPTTRDNRIQWHLYIGGKDCEKQAAVWIALTYPELIQNEYFPGAEIDHIDTDKLNNHPSNLRWVDRRGNQNNNLTRKHLSVSGEGKHTNLNGKWVIKLSKNNEILHFYPSLMEAERDTGVLHQHIYLCCTGKRKTAGKFVWKYSD